MTTPADPTRRAPEEEDERGDAVVFGAPKDVRPMTLTFTGSRRGTPLVAPEDGDDPTRRAPEEEINGLAIPDDAATALRRFGFACRAWGVSGTRMMPQEARDAEGELIGAIARLAVPSPVRPDEVVVRREDLERAIDWYDLVHREWQAESNDLEACDRLRAALTAAQTEGD